VLLKYGTSLTQLSHKCDFKVPCYKTNRVTTPPPQCSTVIHHSPEIPFIPISKPAKHSYQGTSQSMIQTITMTGILLHYSMP